MWTFVEEVAEMSDKIRERVKISVQISCTYYAIDLDFDTFQTKFTAAR
jgi:biotin synthase-related radical SAM superfamily protein